jgi:hypothetical protein
MGNPLSANVILVPKSEGWPLVAAFGLSLVFAGLLTHALVSLLGAVALCAGLVGWFREVLPAEAHTALPLAAARPPAPAASTPARHPAIGEQGHRARLPLEIYSYSAGMRGGLVGGVAMALLALGYGWIAHGSIWYPINLLAASASAEISAMDTRQLGSFTGLGLVLALVIHGAGSALVGLLYAVALPMFPRRPVLLGGILAPLFWSGILYSTLGVINPLLQDRIDWGWFIASQFAFGLVAGWVVGRHEKVATFQHLPFAVRAGIETPGAMEERPEKGGDP